MKKTTLLFAAAATLALAACSSDLPNNGNSVTENEETRFVQITIANPPSTRAAQFEDGTDEENIVKHAFFIFYDQYGGVVGENSIVDMTFANNTAGSNLSVDRIATTTVRLQIPKGSNTPKYVMAFLNPVSYDEIGKQTNMNDLRNQERDDYLCIHGNFAMNNSVYYGTNSITGQSNVKILGAPVKSDQLYKTAEAAKADGASQIEIYVERYAAKVKLTLAGNSLENNDNIKPQTIGESDKAYTLKFVPEAWTINADAPKMYASKRFENKEYNDNEIPTYDDVQEMLGTWVTWNDPTNHRSYWACSPSYYATEYPSVSDEIIDKATSGTGAGVAVPPYALRYYSYNQITDPELDSEGLGVTAFNDGGTNYKYVLENTMGGKAFNCSNPKAAAPSALIVGHYVLYKGTTVAEGTKINYDPGFCLYGDNLYFIDNVPTGVAGAVDIKTVLLNSNGILATSSDGKTILSASSEQSILNCLEVRHPTHAVHGTQKVPHRYVTLQLKYNLNPSAYEGLYYKPAGSDTWQPVKATEKNTLDEIITDINKLLWAQLGNARIYRGNKGYFSIPIQHLGITENPVASQAAPPIAEDGSVNWKNVRVGDFGLVRNHVYTIKIDGIEGLASGIDGPDNPLVPSMEDEDYWVNYKINILGWRVVPTQGNIILK